MNLFRSLQPRIVVLLLLWLLPALLYLVLGLVALIQTGWMWPIAWILPLMWLAAWLVGKFWPPPRPDVKRRKKGQAWKPPAYWTPADSAAIEIVESFRDSVPAVDRMAVSDPNRYIADAQQLAARLAKHYHSAQSNHALQPLTLVEVLAAVHLAVEDLEAWVLEKVPGSSLATFGHLDHMPALARVWDWGQTIAFLATTVTNPAKLATYPLWRKAGRVTIELQNELVRAFYRRYLKQTGFYLIEMYSGRLRGGSKQYRQRFLHTSMAVHAAGGETAVLEQAAATSTTIAVLGQVKAGKSSLINALMQERVASTSVLPETRQVKRFEYALPDSSGSLVLLDTPGYAEADISRQQKNDTRTASQSADIILLVMAVNSSARDADVELVRELREYYDSHLHLKPPPIIGVLTHVDLLRPPREWSPPYNWRQPRTAKEQSIAGAVAYQRELFGESLVDFACVNTRGGETQGAHVADELLPLLLEHLQAGQAAAILRGFYRQMSQQRFQKLKKQFSGLLNTIGESLLDN